MDEFSYTDTYFLENASEEELRAVDDAMREKLKELDYDSNEYYQINSNTYDVVNAITSRFPVNLSKREHGWYLSNDD